MDGSGKNTTDVVDVYDKSLTKLASIALRTSAAYIGSITIGGYALLAGGYAGKSDVDVYQFK